MSKFISIVVAAAVAALLCSPTAYPLYAAADDNRPAKPADDNSNIPLPNGSQSADAKPKSKLDDELLKQLTGEGNKPQAKDDNLIEETIQSMRAAQDRIADRDTGKQTRKLQEKIIENLAKLIKLAQQPPQRSKQPQNKPPMPPSNSTKQNDGDAKSSKQPQQTAKNQNKGKSKDEAKDSTDRVDKSEARKLERELARRRALIAEIWGHLPPTLREKMLNIYREKTLPKYEELTRRYYEALAEPRAKRRSR